MQSKGIMLKSNGKTLSVLNQVQDKNLSTLRYTGFVAAFGSVHIRQQRQKVEIASSCNS